MKKPLLLLTIIICVLSKKKKIKKSSNKNKKRVINQPDGSYLSLQNVVGVVHSPFPTTSTIIQPKRLAIVVKDAFKNPIVNQVAHPFISDYSLVSPDYAKPKIDVVKSIDIGIVKDGKVENSQFSLKAHNIKNIDGSVLQNRVIAMHGLDTKRRIR